MRDFDFFISHASEDKADVALPIAKGLREIGYSVWIDAGELTVGDRLLRNINEGLARSRYGVVILSRAFFEKDWPQWELEGLVAKENAERRKVILPVWHQLTLGDIAAAAPILAGRLATDTSAGIEHVINDLVHAYQHGPEEVRIDALIQSDIPEIAELFEQEPLDLYADAQEEFELGNAATNRIVHAMNVFTAKAQRFNSENQALAAAGTQMGSKALRARINLIVPIFDEYSSVIEQNAHAMGESMGKALLLITRGLVLDTDQTADRRQKWLSTLEAVEVKAGESKAVMEQGLETMIDLKGYTVLMKHSKRRLAERVRQFIDAHEKVIDDIREARRLLSDE